MDIQLHPGHWSTATGALMSPSPIPRRLLHSGLRARRPLYRIPSRQTIDGYVCNGLMNTGPGDLIGTKYSFQMNPASISGAMMAAFVLDALPVNAAFQSALSNDIVA
ncbi:HTH_Tnp_Tc3_2 domain-containing protein [Trichonephila clavipes]|uniref:HTH_Tnp_Tc3_2 domain-containing protein n=1 Tax=Trichonephila clavipes TaxID=2585209 RepID=A0A8X6SC49_TRICX|nr:HTH_Tnp_Tc3_2 domain-containing protein [Trichonephila clavipes]